MHDKSQCPLADNSASSIKPEAHSALKHDQNSNEPRRQATGTENLANLGCVVSEICEQTDRQMNIIMA